MINNEAAEKFLAHELGLSQNEILIYTNLLKNGPQTVLELSVETGIKRATVHVNIDYLSKKKLVGQVHKGRGSRRLIIAEPPARLITIIQNKQAELDMAAKQVTQVASFLSTLTKDHTTNSEGMEVRHYRGKNEVRFIYDEVILANEVRSYLNYKELIKIFPANTSKFLETQEKHKNLHMWEILEDSKEAKKYISQTNTERYHAKLATDDLTFTALDYVLFDGQIGIIDLSSDANINGLLMKNQTFYENARNIHKCVWDLLPEYQK